MAGIIGKKIGMSSLYNDQGERIPVTLILTKGCVVTQIKTKEVDKYESVQLAFDDKREKNTTKPLVGHFQKANTTPKRKLAEFRDANLDISQFSIGDEIKLENLFQEGDFVDVTGISKGKGFQGVVKRYGFKGVGDSTHGQHNRQRHPGSIGASSYPSRVFKGMRMAGRTGGKRVKVENLQVVKIFQDEQVVAVKGPCPGAKNNYLLISI